MLVLWEVGQGFWGIGGRISREYVYLPPGTLPGAPWGPRRSKMKVLGVPGGVCTPISSLPYLSPIPIVETHTTYRT